MEEEKFKDLSKKYIKVSKVNIVKYGMKICSYLRERQK